MPLVNCCRIYFSELYVISFFSPTRSNSQEGIEYQERVGLFDFTAKNFSRQPQQLPIWHNDVNNMPVVEDSPEPYKYFLPTWQESPLFGMSLNENIMRTDAVDGALVSLETESVVISEFLTAPPGDMDSEDPRTAFFALLLSTAAQEKVVYQGDPMSRVFYPLFDSFRDNRTTVGTLIAWINWGNYFERVLPKTILGIDVVLQDSCQGAFTYRIDGEEVQHRRAGDAHERAYDSKKRSASFEAVSNIADGTKHGLPLNQDHCQIKLDVYPSSDFFVTYETRAPFSVTLSVAVIFVFTAIMFIIYDRLVERRQALVMWNAEQHTAIVSNLFPESVRNRLIQANDQLQRRNSLSSQIRSLKKDGSDAPIADLFCDCTVLVRILSRFTIDEFHSFGGTPLVHFLMILLSCPYKFADIAGFTAWR